MLQTIMQGAHRIKLQHWWHMRIQEIYCTPHKFKLT